MALTAFQTVPPLPYPTFPLLDTFLFPCPNRGDVSLEGVSPGKFEDNLMTFIESCPKCQPHATKEQMAECLMDNSYPRCSPAAAAQ
jgi:hypothetical protein